MEEAVTIMTGETVEPLLQAVQDFVKLTINATKLRNHRQRHPIGVHLGRVQLRNGRGGHRLVPGEQLTPVTLPGRRVNPCGSGR